MSSHRASSEHNNWQLEHNSSQYYQQGMLPPAHQPHYFHSSAQTYQVETNSEAATAPSPEAAYPLAPQPAFWLQQPPQSHQPEYPVRFEHPATYPAVTLVPNQRMLTISQLPLLKEEIQASHLVEYFKPQIGLIASKGAIKEFIKKLGLTNNWELQRILANAPDKNFSKCTDPASFESVLTEAIKLWQNRSDLGFKHLEDAIRFWVEKTQHQQPLSVYALLAQDRIAQKLPLTQHLEAQVVSLHHQLQQYQFNCKALQAENHRLNETLKSQSSHRKYNYTTSSLEAASDKNTKLEDELKSLSTQNNHLKTELGRLKKNLEQKELELEGKEELVQEMSQKMTRIQQDNIELLTQKTASMMPLKETNIAANNNQGNMAITVNTSNIVAPSKRQLTTPEKKLLQQKVDQEILAEFMSPYCQKKYIHRELGRNFRFTDDQVWDVEHDETNKRTPGPYSKSLDIRKYETWEECFARRAIHYWVESDAGSKNYLKFLTVFSQTTGEDYNELAFKLLLHFPI
ncbi:hypothetical protein D5018_10870 [Parashewanella curva]|uniref:Uncharacterized protein n=1 Tax=Parashewanella curva TaxID=2338552 RepID=A0A3L8PYS8_9GAMM|nr:hypothetical protein [Parashewanella curva]RLV59648.1 hypothetical protein D5018_10870 [Parashewanella curva]